MKEIPEDLELLDNKIAALKQKEQAARHEKGKSDLGRASSLGVRIGAELLSAVIVGGAVGYVVDSICGTRPWFLVVFLFFGGAAGILNVYRLSQREDINK